MTQYLMLRSSNCKGCYKCIRQCPVKSISFSSENATIIADECILCGQCYVNCPQTTKFIRNDLETAKQFLDDGVAVYASIAPSFVANYKGATIASMEKALKKLGFAGVEETAIGATIVSSRYNELVDSGEQDVIVSTSCHTINLLVQKHFPGALPYMAKVISPMQAHAKHIKTRIPDAKVVFIGPCISKKEEADRYAGIVDCVLTFGELSRWLKAEGVDLVPEDDNNNDSKARLYPTRGGILRTMDTRDKDFTYLAIDGIEGCTDALRDIIDGGLKGCFIEMSACIGSCIGGPAMEQLAPAPLKHYVTVNNYAGKQQFKVDIPPQEALEKDISFVGIHKHFPGNHAVTEVLKKMNKTLPEHELNCGSCGYATCRQKAVAVLQGKADVTMCLPFLMERAQSFSETIIKNTPNGIIVLNEDLEVQQINAAACRMMNIRSSRDILGDQVVRILDPQPFLEVLSKGMNAYDVLVYLAEYQRYVRQTILLDRSNHVLILIMRDVTEEESGRAKREELSQKTIEITDKVIEKQMRTVQEIASLLGETTAETKIALTKLKETLRDE